MSEIEGYFGQKSLSWKVYRERALLLGATRTLLLQLSNPKIAAAVARYSNFQQDPLGRLKGTTNAMGNIIFGDKTKADKTILELKRIHKRIKGETFSAGDPDLKMWVLATLFESSLITYETFFKKFKENEKEKFYRETKKLARLFDIPEKKIPGSFKDFEMYYEKILESKELAVPYFTKTLIEKIMDPSPIFLKPTAFMGNVIAKATLDPKIRRMFKLKWDKGQQLQFRIMILFVRNILPLTPPVLRFDSNYRAAQKRVHFIPLLQL